MRFASPSTRAARTGNANNLYYLSDPLLPSLNPFINNAPTGLTKPAFEQYPRQFETDLARSSILSGSVEAPKRRVACAYALALDATDDTVHRTFPSVAPEEAVDLHVPQAILTFSHSAPNLTYAFGEGRFGVRGAYALDSLDNVDVYQRVFFAGVEAAAAPHSSWLLEWRRYITDGIPISGETLPPSYTGTRLIIQQRFAFQ